MTFFTLIVEIFLSFFRSSVLIVWPKCDAAYAACNFLNVQILLTTVVPKNLKTTTSHFIRQKFPFIFARDNKLNTFYNFSRFGPKFPRPLDVWAKFFHVSTENQFFRLGLFKSRSNHPPSANFSVGFLQKSETSNRRDFLEKIMRKIALLFFPFLCHSIFYKMLHRRFLVNFLFFYGKIQDLRFFST